MGVCGSSRKSANESSFGNSQRNVTKAVVSKKVCIIPLTVELQLKDVPLFKREEVKIADEKVEFKFDV